MTPDRPSNAGASAWDDLTDRELEAIHEVELGVEWLHRAHGHLVAFHHNTGHAADHFAEAEGLLRTCGRDAAADVIRDRLLPRGVVDRHRWSYDVLEDFEEGFLAAAVDFADDVLDDLAGGERHVAERAQERAWKRRAAWEE